jgi:hypothetical protein
VISILSLHHISKLSRYFWSAVWSVQVPASYKALHGDSRFLNNTGKFITRLYLSRPRRRCYLGSQLDTKVRILAFILIFAVTWLNLNQMNLSLLLWCYYIGIKPLSLFVWIVDKIWVHIMWQEGIWTSRLFHILGVFVTICKGK